MYKPVPFADIDNTHCICTMITTRHLTLFANDTLVLIFKKVKPGLDGGMNELWMLSGTACFC